MTISFRFRFFISQPEILMKSEQTFCLKITMFQKFCNKKKLYSTFPLVDIQSVDKICTLFKPYFLNVVSTIIPSSTHLIISFLPTVTNLLSKSNCIFFSFFIREFKLIDSINIFQDSHRIYQVRFTFVKVFYVHALLAPIPRDSHYSNPPLINKNGTRVNFCDFVTKGTT